VARACANVPFYRERFRQAGLDPSRVRTVGDLGQIPVTEREDLRREGESFLARGTVPARCARVITSGSTGVPVTLYFSTEEVAVRNALSKRMLLLYRQYPWQRTLLVGNPRSARPSLYQRLGIYGERRLSAFLPQSEQARLYRAYRPHILAGYPSSLALLGEGLRRDGGPILCPRIILSGGEMLLPGTRESLTATFKAPVRDCYGVEEMGHIAWECPAGGGYHLVADCGVFEVLEGNEPVGPGEEGDLVLTSLFGRTMPLIRYRIGDRVVLDPDPCTCRCAFPRIRRILGRSDDLLQLSNGQWVHPVVAACGVVDAPGVERFRIIQEGAGSFSVELVTGGPLSEALRSGIVSYFRSHLGAREVVVRRVGAISPGRSGKLRHIVFKPHRGVPRDHIPSEAEGE
jgi:phenylacetate-CoA ligase